MILIRKSLGITLTDSEISELSKYKWKRLTRNIVRRESFNSLLTEKQCKKKLNNLGYNYDDWKCAAYISSFTAKQAEVIFRVRTHTLQVTGNNCSSAQLKTKCLFCKLELDTQEHFFTCISFDTKLSMQKFFDSEMDSFLVDEVIDRLEDRKELQTKI